MTILKGFEGAVGNGMHSRTGGVLALKKLRKGLQKLSDEIIEQVEAIADV